MPTYIDGTEVEELWSEEIDPLFDSADTFAAVYENYGGQHYLRVEHANGGRHVLRITSAEAEQIISTTNHRLVFWAYLGAEIEAEEHGDVKQAERLRAKMKLKWEAR